MAVYHSEVIPVSRIRLNIICIIYFSGLHQVINNISYSVLTHWGGVTHICVSQLDHHCFRSWPVACTAPSHYLNQCWTIVNWTLSNKLQCNLNRNSNTFIQENALESVVCEMAAILSRPQCVKHAGPFHRHHHSEFLACFEQIRWKIQRSQ